MAQRIYPPSAVLRVRLLFMLWQMMRGRTSDHSAGGSWATTPSEGFVEAEVSLCVPQDNLQDLEFYPNFSNDWIALSGLQRTPEHQSFTDSAMQEPANNFLKTNNFEPTTSSAKSTSKRRKVSFADWSEKPRAKGPAKVSNARSSFLPLKAQEKHQRSCSHCQAEKTPQWRMGPRGPKTLCNACGVRYKSGRLVPEYRPAASPSFDSTKHSNYHRKIVQKKSL